MISSSPIFQTPKQVSAVRKSRRRRLIIAFIILLPALILADMFWIEPALMLTVTRYDISCPSLPENWAGRTIAFFSDAHLGESYPPPRLQRIVSVLQHEQPDLILFGGDLIDSRTPETVDYDEAIISVLSQMQAPLGQYAVAGNHDNRLRSEYERIDYLFTESGFTLLNNESVYLDGVWLGGLAESYFGAPDVDLAFSPDGLIHSQQTDSGDMTGFTRLLLMHQPDYAAGLPADSADLIFSGHSHNGQVTIFGRPILTVYEGADYPYGYYQLSGNRQLIVSRGLGTVEIAARFFAPPEIVIVTLQSAETTDVS